MATLGERLKKARKSKNLSLREVEKKTGISFSYLSQLENDNKQNPSMKLLSKLADLYGVKTSYFIASEESLDSLTPEQKQLFEELLTDEKKQFLLRQTRGMSEEDLITAIRIIEAFKKGKLNNN